MFFFNMIFRIGTDPMIVPDPITDGFPFETADSTVMTQGKTEDLEVIKLVGLLIAKILRIGSKNSYSLECKFYENDYATLSRT